MISSKIIKIDPQNPQGELLNQAAEAIKNGRLVIIPTETVYGIAANFLNKRTIERLFEIKKRPAEKPFSFLVDKREKIEEYARNIPIGAYKVVDKFWPGPLTVILRSKNTGTIGLRMPDNQIALKIIELVGVPIVCPSANLSGKSAPKNFLEAIADLDVLVDLAIDAGDTTLGLESSVLDLTVSPIKVLREGAIKATEIHKILAKKTVLFVCTGNSCRSVMAKAFLEKKLEENKRQDVEVLSAGIVIFTGLGVTQETKEVLAKEGIDVSSHRSAGLTNLMIKKSDIILVMEKVHEERILQLAPEVKNRVFLLKEFANPVRNTYANSLEKISNGTKINDNKLNIEDPIGKSREFYEGTFAIIKEAIERILDII